MNSGFFIIGSAGNRNVGDDAILVAFLNCLDRLLTHPVSTYIYVKEIYVLDNLKTLYNVKVVKVCGFLDFFKAFTLSSSILICGGDYLDDYGSRSERLRNYMTFFIIVLASRFFSKKFLMLNNGFRVNTSSGLMTLKLILNLTCCVSVRDEASYRLVSECMSRSVIKGFDTTALLDAPNFVSMSLDDHSDNYEIKRVGVSITPFYSNYFSKPENDRNLAKVIAKELGKTLNDMKNVEIYFLIFNTSIDEGDLNIVRTVMQNMNPLFIQRVKLIEYRGDIPSFISKLSQLDFIVCCKYHSVIFSYLLNKPMLIISYHPKNEALAHEIGLSDSLLSIGDVLNRKLSSMLSKLIMNPEEFRAKLPLSEAKRRAFNGIQKCMLCI